MCTSYIVVIFNKNNKSIANLFCKVNNLYVVPTGISLIKKDTHKMYLSRRISLGKTVARGLRNANIAGYAFICLEK